MRPHAAVTAARRGETPRRVPASDRRNGSAAQVIARARDLSRRLDRRPESPAPRKQVLYSDERKPPRSATMKGNRAVKDR